MVHHEALPCVCFSSRLRFCSSLTYLDSGNFFTLVDIYNISSATWSTAQLSVARSALAATCVGNTAVFAGGSLGVVHGDQTQPSDCISFVIF